jgi:hypothetical protein
LQWYDSTTQVDFLAAMSRASFLVIIDLTYRWWNERKRDRKIVGCFTELLPEKYGGDSLNSVDSERLPDESRLRRAQHGIPIIERHFGPHE